MNRAWFFQANPVHYDIDHALEKLDRIWWRVPQHTPDIHVGDVVAIWRSGKSAGIVGVGRIIAEPQLRAMDPVEDEFVVSPDEAPPDATRVLVQVAQVPFVSKEQVRVLPALQEHQIVRAPMGTVFPLTEREWTELKELIPEPPEGQVVPGGSLPPAFAWQQRAKGVLPMPGGYDRYLDSLRKICTIVDEERPATSELAGRLEDVLEVKATAARLRASFLRKAGIFAVQGGLCKVSPWTETWRQSGDNRVIVSLLHSRCQLIGELLDAANEPKTTDELLGIANERYGMGWDTQTQIGNRRGWLQSAGMLKVTDEGKIQTTDAGRSLVQELTLFVPTATRPEPEPATLEPIEQELDSVRLPTQDIVEELVDAVKQSSIDSSNPDRFEQAVRDAFAFLGFQAEWLGGSGKTDVLLDALIGKADTYRVIVDCKTSASGSVSDQQVDWVTLDEHKLRHDAQFVAVVAPNPTGGRLFDRAKGHHVTLISADQLAGLCRQHSKVPLGLGTYRTLFEEGGAVDTQLVDEKAEDDQRIMKLAAVLCQVIRIRSTELMRLTARDLYVLLSDDSVAEGATEEEIEELLATLASPLLGVLDGSPDLGYRVTNSPQVFRQRFGVIATLLDSAKHPTGVK